MADGADEGIRIIDVTDKSNPALNPVAFNTGGDARDIKISEREESADYACIADYDFGLVMAEISSSDGQLSLSSNTFTGIGNARAVAVYYLIDNDTPHYYAAVVDNNRLTIVDISDPVDPQIRDSINASGARDVAVSYPYAAVAAGSAGIRVFDISNPGNLEEVGEEPFATNAPAEAVSMYASYIHAAVGHSGIVVIGISDTDPPELTPIDLDPDEEVDPYYNTPGSASDIFIAERQGRRYTYVADNYGGFLSIVHEDRFVEGIYEQPFTESPDDSARIECFITSLF